MRSLLPAFVGLVASGGALGCHSPESEPASSAEISAAGRDSLDQPKAEAVRESWGEKAWTLKYVL